MKKKIVSILLCVVLVFALGMIAFAADAAITAQPQSQTAAENEMVTFSVSVTGDVSYRWQYCPAGSDTWTNAGVEGCKSDTINVKATQYRDGQSYRCMLTCADGSVIYSDPAVLTLSKDAELKILEQPESVTASVGDTVTMHVTASGSGLNYLWQYRDADGSTWNKCGLEGRDTDTLTVPVTNGRNGMSYHCVVTDASGATVTSDPAVLTVGGSSAIIFTAQPSDVTAAAGDTVSFHVDASGDNLTYLWQYCDKGSSAWSKCGMNSRTSDTLLVPVTVYRDGISYRCVITDGSGNVVESDAAKLTVADASVIEITAQPENASAVIGETVTFSVKASGDDLSYLWQYKDSDKSTWKKCGLDGRDSDTLTVPVTAARDGMSYHCIITDAVGNSVVSADAVLTATEPVVDDSPTIAVETVKAAPGDTSVTVVVSVKNNPGIMGMGLCVSYDESALTMKSAKNGEALSMLTYTAPGKLQSGYTHLWDAMDLSDDDIRDGAILVLTFDVAADAAGTYPIELSYNDGDIFDGNLDSVDFTIVNGAVVVG